MSLVAISTQMVGMAYWTADKNSYFQQGHVVYADLAAMVATSRKTDTIIGISGGIREHSSWTRKAPIDTISASGTIYVYTYGSFATTTYTRSSSQYNPRQYKVGDFLYVKNSQAGGALVNFLTYDSSVGDPVGTVISAPSANDPTMSFQLNLKMPFIGKGICERSEASLTNSIKMPNGQEGAICNACKSFVQYASFDSSNKFLCRSCRP